MKRLLQVVILFLLSLPSFAQPGNPGDRIIYVLRGNNITIWGTDNNLTTLVGNAAVRQDKTLIYGDSIVVNQLLNTAEIFGNVHINDADSIHTYANYLRYTGSDRTAVLKRNVRITDGKGTIYGNDVNYNIETGIASYVNGGRVVNGSTVLTSDNASYYSANKDVFFRKNVHLRDPKYNIDTDSLKYNTEYSTAEIISPARVKTKEGVVINTSKGFYNLRTGQAEFYERTTINDTSLSVTGDKIAYDEKSDIFQVEGNGLIVDSVNKVIIMGNTLIKDNKTNSFLATRKPVMIMHRDGDSTYITADTLFSGLNVYKPGDLNRAVDTLTSTKTVDLAAKNDSIRYFIAFHHVKIYNDSLQAVCDSLHFSTFDSTFRLFQNPVVWNDSSQVTGDTMYLFTLGRKPKHISVFNNAMIVNRDQSGLFNQVAGKTLNGNFESGEIKFVRVKGSPAEYIYYPVDDDSAYIGMNRSKSDVIDVYFINRELNKIKLINDVDGTLFPMQKIPEDERFMRRFQWLDAQRPKNKWAIFE